MIAGSFSDFILLAGRTRAAACVNRLHVSAHQRFEYKIIIAFFSGAVHRFCKKSAPGLLPVQTHKNRAGRLW
ncbi:hypothetical protein DPQ25_10050 [Hydrogeniiclostridium mannosilyticum]|uniref:Uncharacterized protein n=1 Tax=Hydrogeniiclostridium mannosilyticum TaxID=2764322 RepID=A0A328UAM9_9FIRM|nr:hypothetical protein DPQ25_10050 [Hydrogeniiclostridium mannosilyticum]